jgi:hypothetical protein
LGKTRTLASPAASEPGALAAATETTDTQELLRRERQSRCAARRRGDNLRPEPGVVATQSPLSNNLTRLSPSRTAGSTSNP